MVHWIIEKLFAKKQGPNSKGEKVGHSSPFRDRQANIVAYRGNVCNQKGSLRVRWIQGRLNAKDQVPKIRDKKDIYISRKGQTDQPTDQQTDRQTRLEGS